MMDVPMANECNAAACFPATIRTFMVIGGPMRHPQQARTTELNRSSKFGGTCRKEEAQSHVTLVQSHPDRALTS
jgi:hypothetical protein